MTEMRSEWDHLKRSPWIKIINFYLRSVADSLIQGLVVGRTGVKALRNLILRIILHIEFFLMKIEATWRHLIMISFMLEVSEVWKNLRLLEKIWKIAFSLRSQTTKTTLISKNLQEKTTTNNLSMIRGGSQRWLRTIRSRSLSISNPQI